MSITVTRPSFYSARRQPDESRALRRRRSGVCCEAVVGVVGEFEVAAAGVATDESALLQGDDRGRVVGQVPLGDAARVVGDGIQQASDLDVQARFGVMEPVQRDALGVGEAPVLGAQPPNRGGARRCRVVLDTQSGVVELRGEGSQRVGEPGEGPAQRLGQAGGADRGRGAARWAGQVTVASAAAMTATSAGSS